MESIEVNRSTSSANVERRKQTSRSHMNVAASAAVQQQQHQNEAVCTAAIEELSSVVQHVGSINNTSICGRLEHTSRADLADPHFDTVGRIDMIIGVANFYTFLKEGRIRLHEKGPLFVETVFGWVVTGSPLPPEQKMAMRWHFNIITPSLEDQIERFWKAEEIDTTQTADERYCEEFFKSTVSRDATGRYIVKLPKHQQHDKLIGASKATALRRFGALERKLGKNDELRHQYHDFMAEYIALHHMTPVEDDAADGPAACYLPHHPVFKDTSTTKRGKDLAKDNEPMLVKVLETKLTGKAAQAMPEDIMKIDDFIAEIKKRFEEKTDPLKEGEQMKPPSGNDAYMGTKMRQAPNGNTDHVLGQQPQSQQDCQFMQ
ncbi:uncharacterized protein LOC131291485 [Anopheles ziemanni]|uniref:uncharacterized protein LOC131269829 n=1 Tax=Anopheles coustani TaxID=139045 RepID=UPI002658B98B|nr:uncharacterized protein LOC131269829 [Anopheles coustani]XP_058176688.1 uncharacterized protein LOC131291485 [Anopheles ziemanni]